MKITPDIEKLFDQWAREAARSGRDIAVLPLKKKITDHLKDLFPGDDFVEINGQTYKIREYAKTVTDHAKIVQRTERRKAQTEVVMESMKQFDEDLVEIPPHDNPCDICKPYQGQVYSISGTNPDYPKLPDGGPPWCLGCECTMNPTSERALKWRKEWDRGDKQ